MIEMKDFQEVQTHDDWNDEEEDEERISSPSENFDIEQGGGRVNIQGKSRNNRSRYILIASIIVLFIIAIVGYYVGGIYLVDDDLETLMEHDSGIVENNVENPQQEKKKQNQQNNNSWGGRPANPFVDKMNTYQHNNPGSHVTIGHHSGGAGGSKATGGGIGGTMNKHNGVGKFGHDGQTGGGGRIPGGFANHNKNINDNNDEGGSVDQEQDNSNKQTDPPVLHPPTNPPTIQEKTTDPPTERERSNNPPPPAPTEVDEKDIYCEDLKPYQQWYDQTITKDDGKMYNVLKQFDHDAAAFTYVMENSPPFLSSNIRDVLT
jgi:hypothetical protein